MPSRRSSASTPPRSAHAAASRTMRSFSDAENDRLPPDFGTTSTDTPLGRAAPPCAVWAGRASPDERGSGGPSTETPLGRGAPPCAAWVGVGSTVRSREGLGTGQVHPPPSLHRFRREGCLSRRWHRGDTGTRVFERGCLCELSPRGPMGREKKPRRCRWSTSRHGRVAPPRRGGSPTRYANTRSSRRRRSWSETLKSMA